MVRVSLHMLVLSGVCLATYFAGLTTHGLTNWQEGQRALVAREMHERGDWIVPTAQGEAYLAKPPLIYWCQMAIAEARGGLAGEFDLRLTVALAGWVGTLLTYLAARRLVGAPGETSGGEGPLSTGRDWTAFLAALLLATGILPARSARIGELDILLIPTTVGAVWALSEAWRVHRGGGRWLLRFGCVGLATAGAVLAALAKGPPALLVIGLACYGGIALYEGSRAPPPGRKWAGPITGGLALGAAAVVGNGGAVEAPGLVLFTGMGAVLGAIVQRCARAGPARRIGSAWLHTGVVPVLAVPLLALWGWTRLVAARIGPDAVVAAAAAETEDNLRVLVWASPINNLEAMSYGVGLGSGVALIAAAWLLLRRPRMAPEWYVVIAWVGLSLIGFSTLGKGVGRYLTPVWPGVAMLGALWLGNLERDPAVGARWAPRVRAAVVGGCVVLAVGQGVWYGWLREERSAARSPRALVRELLDKGYEAERLAVWDFASPAVHYYAGRPVRKFSFREASDQGVVRGSGWGNENALVSWVRSVDEPVVLLLPEGREGTLLDGLRAQGIAAREIETEAVFGMERGERRVRAVELRVAG